MSFTICLSPTKTLSYPKGGGHLWVYLNWALGLRANGCRVVWLECAEEDVSPDTLRSQLRTLKARLDRYGLADAVALCDASGNPVRGLDEDHFNLDAAVESDLLINLRYAMPASVVRRFRRSVLVDIDPGQLQIWMKSGSLQVAPHDVYFTIGQAVGRRGGPIPDVGIEWHHILPCVALDHWPDRELAGEIERPFTTVAHWRAGGWFGEGDARFRNQKRDGFKPFLNLPGIVSRPLELALDLPRDDDRARHRLLQRGWRVVNARTVASTPWDYQRYLQESFAEFSCVKPICVRLQAGWISDRTVCYLATGRPAVVQDTGENALPPDVDGLFRFRTLDDARRAIEAVAVDYSRHSRAARELAERFFDARKITATVLERCLG